MNSFLYSTVLFLLALFFLLLGSFCLLFVTVAELRDLSIQYLLNFPLILLLFGVSFLIVGLAMAIHLFFNSRKKIYTVNNNPKLRVDVNQVIIEKTVLHYLESHYPAREIPVFIKRKKGLINIYAELPFEPEQERESIVAEMDSELQTIFIKVIGATDKISFQASFQERKKSGNQAVTA